MGGDYLELLKRALQGALTEEALIPVEGHGARRPLVRAIEGAGFVLARRRTISPMYMAEGRPEGPLVGRTMIGRKRLDNLHMLIEDVLERDVPGDLIEAGVWKGGAAMLMRGVLNHHGSGRTVVAADSFEGLPPGHGFENFADLAASRDEVEAAFRRFEVLEGVEFLEGWFSDTLPTVRDRTWAIVRLDGDLYESTMDGLTNLYPGLSVSGHMIVDDYGDLEPCRRAVDEYREAHSITEPIVQIDWSGVYWTKQH